jgi:hypothetical protein
MPACLAISLGIILARAACQPTASSEDHPTTTSARVITTTNINSTTTTTTTIPSVQLIFPKPGATSATTTTTTHDNNNNNDNDPIATQVEWHHLAPWHNKKTTTSTAGTATENKFLVSYTISIGSTNINHHHQQQQQQQFTEDHRRHQDEITLAHAVATFLLETKLWQWYTRPGGVLLFVMALIHSRTPSKIQSDMDDANAKLTSQFGHCSQELLNLLLTGQAGRYTSSNCFLLLIVFVGWKSSSKFAKGR